MEYPAMRDPEENNDRYDQLALRMDCKPEEIPHLIQQHAPWNGSAICESTRAEREAMCEFLLAAKVPDHVVKGIARGEHIRFSSRRALRLSEQVANHYNFAWREGMRVISLNDGLKFRLIGPDEEPRLVTGTLLPNAVEWRVPSALTARHVPDLDDPATASMLCARWLPNTVFGVALAEALLLLWSAE